MFSIKFCFEKEERRTSYDVTERLTFRKLQQMILKFFPTLEGKEYRVCYHDDENDLVTFSSDEELGDAMELMMSKSNTLKFTILLFPSENLQSEYEDNSRKSKLGRVVPKNANPLPSSLSPQEAVAASALLHQN